MCSPGWVGRVLVFEKTITHLFPVPNSLAKMRALAAVFLAATAARPSPPLPPHPRLVLSARACADVRGFASNSSVAAALLSRTVAQADWYVSAHAPDGGGDARYVLQQSYALAVAHCATANASYAERAIAEVLQAARRPEWDTNGSAQLNTGEMAHALGFALDYFHAQLSVSERAEVAGAVTALALARVREALGPSPPPWAGAFVNTSSNWNMVVLGGSLIGALAVGDEPGVPAWVLAEFVPAALAAVFASVDDRAGGGWGPDGEWREGANYAGYGARYLAPLIASLRGALGPSGDGGLLASPGVLQAPHFLLQHLVRTTPERSLWAWGDTRFTPETISQYLFFAREASDPGAEFGVRFFAEAIEVAVDTTETDAMNAPVALVYYSDKGTQADFEALPLVRHFEADHLVTSRSSWAEDDAANVFIAFKGLNVSWAWAHNHLDQGSFVYAARGQWWAQDLGSDNYDAPSYFWKNRFDLYRTGTSGHNTLSFDGKNARCEITGTYSTNCSTSAMTIFNVSGAAPSAALAVDAFAVVDLSDAYAYLGVASARRGFIVAGGRTQLITVDEAALATDKSVSAVNELWWSMHTVAEVSLSSDLQTATLQMWNVTDAVTVTVIASQSSCPGVAFTSKALVFAPPLLEAPNATRLWLAAPAATCARLVVAVGVVPVVGGFSVRPLSEWGALGPVG